MSFVVRPIPSDVAKASLLERTDQMREVAVDTGRPYVSLTGHPEALNPVLITGNETVTS